MHHVTRSDGVRLLCPHCDPFNQLRLTYEADNVEYVQQICKRHSMVKHTFTQSKAPSLIQQWLQRNP